MKHKKPTRVAVLACGLAFTLIAAVSGSKDVSASKITVTSTTVASKTKTTVASKTTKTTVASKKTAAASKKTTTTTAVAAPVAAPKEIRLADIFPNASFAVRYAAMGIGAFDKVEKQFGLKINITEAAAPRDTLLTMVGGQADVSVSSLIPYLQVEQGGQHVAGTFAPFLGGGGVLVGLKKYEADRGTNLAKYKGSIMGYTREGSNSQLLLQLACENSGMVWADQKKIALAFGATTAALPLLQAGKVDLIATDPTTAVAAIDAGVAYLVLNFNDPKTATSLVGYQIGTVYAFNQSFVDKYPEVTAAFTAALGKGLQAINAVGDDAAKVLALFPASIQKQLADGWAKQWALVAPGIMGTDGSIPQKYIDETVRFGVKTGQLTPAQSATDVVSAVIDNSFIQKYLRG